MVVLLATTTNLLQAAPLGTAFTYQGKLTDSGTPAQGIYDLRFAVYDSAGGGNAVAGPVTNSPVGVTNGMFTVTLDLGARVFSGQAVWLEIAARTNGSGAFATFPVRQSLTAAPYALYAANAGMAGAAAVSAGSLNTVGAPSSGQVLTYNGSQLAWLSLSSTGAAWSVTGNHGTAPGASFLGTTDNQPLEFKVNGQRALRLEPNTNAAPNLIGGSPINYVGPGVVGATVGGGGATAYNGATFSNAVKGDFSVVGGGGENMIQTNSVFATIAGGGRNTIGLGAVDATIGGGWNNTVQTYAKGATIGGGEFNRVDTAQGTVSGGSGNAIEGGANHATIGGGYGNLAQESAFYATVAGGGHNEIHTNAAFGAIGGGSLNTVETGAQYATVPGGLRNVAGGNYSFAAGRRAKALNNGAFVWADSADADFASTSSNQFLIRASGGVGIGVSNPTASLDVAGTVKAVALAVGSSTVVTNLNAELLNGLRATNFWQLGGNSALRPGEFLGTTDNSALELRVNGQRALRLEPIADTPPYRSNLVNVLGGSRMNYIAPGAEGSVIAGGGAAWDFGVASNAIGSEFCFIGGGEGNRIATNAGVSVLGGGVANEIWTGANFSVLSGGYGNSIQTGARASVLGGGSWNSIQTNAYHSVLGGGSGNSIGTNAYHSVLGGGAGNSIQTGARASVLGGGGVNSIGTNAEFSVLSGGFRNSIQTNAWGSVISGGRQNSIQTSAWGSVISGGCTNTILPSAGLSVLGGGKFNQIAGSESVLGGGVYNSVETWDSFLGGGGGNSIGMAAGFSCLGGGYYNSIGPNAHFSFLGGGDGNIAYGPYVVVCGGVSNLAGAEYATVGGGRGNTAGIGAFVGGGGWEGSNQSGNTASGIASAISGGWGNTAGGIFSAIAGGTQNTASGEGAAVGGGSQNTASRMSSTVPGGEGNVAGGYCSFAAGRRAKVYGDGTFVWADSVNHDLTVTANDQFIVRASGGCNIWTGVDPSGVATGGVFIVKGGVDWHSWCDRNLKQNFKPVDDRAVLEKVAQLPVTEWNLITQDPTVRHIGPVAQDFHAAFNLGGSDDKSINNTDAHGVLFAAVKGLNQKVEEDVASLRAENAALKRELAELKDRLDAVVQKP